MARLKKNNFDHIFLFEIFEINSLDEWITRDKVSTYLCLVEKS